MITELWDLSEAPRIAEFYNRQIQTLPFSDPVDPAEFLAGMRWSQAPQLIQHDQEQFAVCRSDDQVLGYAHIGASRPRDSQEEHGLIRLFSYEPGQTAAGRSVLELAEQTFVDRGLSHVIAFRVWHGYRFYHVGRGFLVDRWTHVLGLLQCEGYELEEDGVLLQLPSLDGPEAQMPASIAGSDVVVASGSDEPAWVRIQLMKADRELARCVGRPLSIHHSGSAAGEGFMIEGLHVAEELRGLGWGKYLLLRMHAELRQRGYRMAVIGTDASNGPALLLYGNAGYRMLCSEWSLAKEL